MGGAGLTASKANGCGTGGEMRERRSRKLGMRKKKKKLDTIYKKQE
jgi:hypothetical protein